MMGRQVCVICIDEGRLLFSYGLAASKGYRYLGDRESLGDRGFLGLVREYHFGVFLPLPALSGWGLSVWCALIYRFFVSKTGLVLQAC